MRRLLVNAVASSDLERRRIAQDLHDGVLQDLAGIGYLLSSDTRHIAEGTALRGHMEGIAHLITQDVAALRHLMADIYPPDLETRGLTQSLHDLVAAHDFADAEVTTHIAADLSPSPLAARLAYRVTREVLRNVAAHANASHILVRMGQADNALHLEIRDDGVGFSTGALAPGGPVQAPEGHFGLRLLRETVVDAGGQMTVESAPGSGTVVRARLPV
jgi:signal transduction histidine kinase